MPAKLRVLIIEDSRDDAALILRALRQRPWEVTEERVDTAAAMSAALDKHGWDLIIADYSMPQFSGPAALALAIERGSDLPFILVSGMVDEEAAVQAMKAGADDYLSKRNLARLVPAVERELQAAEGRRKARRIEAEAAELLTRFRTTLSSITDAVIVTDPAARVTFMNPTAERLTGWSQNDALQKPLRDVFNIVNEQSSRTVESPVVKAIRDGAIVGLANHTILIARDGSEWPIDDSAAPILDAAGNIVGVVLVFHDVSNRRKAQHELQISEIRYRRLFKTAHDGILILDAGTAKVLEVNRFLLDLLGYPREHFMGKELWEFGVFKDAQSSKTAMAELQKVGRIRYDDLPLQHRDGRHIPVEFVSNVYREGRWSVIQCNIRDISERIHTEHELSSAKEAAEASSRAKSEFLANMSHEIRTPMSAILGFAEMVLHKDQGKAARVEWARIIQRNALHLLELINEILDLSKIEARQMMVNRISCDLPALLVDVVSLMRPRAVDKGLGFGITFQGSIPHRIVTDPMRLRQILVNLLGNAVKFTAAGKIDVRVTDNGAAGPNIALRVDVIDTGMGITPEQMERLFQPFTQGDESITRKFGGTGLGLTISRQFAKFLGGDITVISQPGVGSTFTLIIEGGSSAGVERLEGLTEATLPAKPDQGVQPNIHLNERILLVEDGQDNQRLLRMQLGDAGAAVVVAPNGQVAVDLATEQPFDLILMDMQMPVMDGYAATAELRRRGLKIPIIALTAYAMSDDRAKCLASGCDDYLSKPVNEETLLKTINQHRGPAHLPATDIGTAATAAGSPAPAPAADASGPIRSSLAGNPRMQKIIPEFVHRLPDKVRKINDLLDHGDLAALRTVVHQLRGASGGYGFGAITEPAARVEESLKAEKELESIAGEVKSLIGIIRRIDGYEESNATAAAGESAK